MDPNYTPEGDARSRWQAWDQFWFKPSDPRHIGMIRLLCGAITLYTTFAFTYRLEEWIGKDGWYNLNARMDVVHHRPIHKTSLLGLESQMLPPPRTAEEKVYRDAYLAAFKVLPPPPYPATKKEMDYILYFGQRFNIDLRVHGLQPPATLEEAKYLEGFTERHKVPPARYPRSDEERIAVEDFILAQNEDPNRLYVQGSPVFSIFLHVTDPAGIQFFHGVILFGMFCFTIGFCTRISAVMTWFGALCYIHRNPVMLFGVDTMMTILLLYLMIGPSGSAYSVDRLIARWWAKNKLGVINAWRGFFGARPLEPNEIAPAGFTEEPALSSSATFAIRMLQIHVCIIYFVAGIAKLQGNAWWNGTALWAVLANYEFAPMNNPIYMGILRWIGSNQLLWETTMTLGTYFTLAFELTYTFLVWNPRTRWIVLTGAVLLHGTIGIFMGLKTFALMMLVMNMAFLTPAEIRWLMGGFQQREAPASASTGTLKKKGLNISAA